MLTMPLLVPPSKVAACEGCILFGQMNTPPNMESGGAAVIIGQLLHLQTFGVI